MAKKQKKGPYNPLDKINLGRSVANALLSSSLKSLPPPSFRGAGIYAIYYFGRNPLYSYISDFNNRKDLDGEWTIYIGKAGGAGSRKGMIDLGEKGTALSKRISKHASSIELGDGLASSDFKCRYLTIDSIWIPLGEQLLIQKFKPLWNTIDGFGNNDPGMGRKNQRTSPWDLLHPGRNYANKDTGNKLISSLEEFKKEVVAIQRETYNELISSEVDKL